MGQIGRRRFLAALGATALAGPFPCRAQTSASVPRVGILAAGTAESNYIRLRRRWINESFARAGYTVGKDIALEWRFARGNIERLNALARELVGMEVDVIVSLGNTYATYAARDATSTIPIVIYAGGISTAKQVAGDLARPIANVTGAIWVEDDTESWIKLFQILRRAAPSVVRVASLEFDRSSMASRPDALGVRHLVAMKEFGFEITKFAVGASRNVPAALERIAAFKPDALSVGPGGGGVIGSRQGEIARFALREKLISISNSPQLVYEGGLLYYGPSVQHVLDRTVTFVVRLLRGAKPADLPIERPQKYETLLNGKTARAIGYTAPPAFLLQIDRVIE